MTPGLYQLLAEKITALRASNARRDAPDVTPVDRDIYVSTGAGLENQIRNLQIAIRENEDFATSLGERLEELAESVHQSRNRALVITYLEEAQSRLLRELGDKNEGTGMSLPPN